MTIDPTQTRGPARAGFTLPEAVMAMVILGIAAAGVMLPFSAGASAQAEGVHKTLAANLANDLMERIATKPFHDPDGSPYDYLPGPEAGEATVADFDNVDDFDGYVEAQGQVLDAGGVVITDPMYANFSRQVTCGYVYVPQQNPPTASPNFILVSVEVRYQGRATVTISRLVSE